MNILCKIRGHKWKDGYCSRCGSEHQGHEWAPQPGICVEKCVICNMSKEVEHSFSPRGNCEYICTNCGKQIVRHKLVPKAGCVAVCINCGAEKADHKWNPVKKSNGTVRAGCKCTVCGADNPEGEHIPTVKMHVSGTAFLVCSVCGVTLRELSREEAAKYAAAHPQTEEEKE